MSSRPKLLLSRTGGRCYNRPTNGRFMQYKLLPALAALLSLSAVPASAQTTESTTDQTPTTIPLTVAPGVPLRVYLTKRISKRVDEPVHAKLLEPIFAFDREVVPAGALIEGHVSRLASAAKMKRASALLGGDLTPLHDAEVEFTEIVMPDGRHIAMHTNETLGLNTIFIDRPPKKEKAPKKGAAKKAQDPKPQDPNSNGGVLGIGKQTARDQINAQISGRTRGVADLVRGPDKMERLEDFLVMKLPYHPQWVRKGTRYDAELRDPLQFGAATFKTAELQSLGSQPPPDSVVHARLITPLSSQSAQQGETVEAVVTQPLFSPDGKLILPEGSRLTGAVTQVHAARWLHRGGQMRFNFQRIDLPGAVARLALPTKPPEALKTQATLAAAESGGQTDIKVDDEGGVKTSEPKTRLIAPAISVLIASKSLDNDEGHRIGNHEGNVGGRTFGGLSGFGLVGAAAAQSSKLVGSALGIYGMAWSVYNTVLARGPEVQFDDNAALDIRFGGGRKPAAASKLRGAAAGGE